MANTTTLPGDLVVNGTIRATGGVTPGLTRTSLELNELQAYTIPTTAWRVYDTYNTPLPAAAASDDLGAVAGTHGTAFPSLQSVDFGATTTTAYARTEVVLPIEYQAGQTVKLRFHAGMQVAADTSCTLDVAVFRNDKDGTATATDLYTGPAQSINDLVFDDYDFSLTASSLSPGDILDVQITIAGTDGATATDYVTAVIGQVQLLCDVKG